MPFGILTTARPLQVLGIGPVDINGKAINQFGNQNSVYPSIFHCCGLGSIANLYLSAFKDFSEEAEYLATLYRQFKYQGHILYVVNNEQSKTSTEHKLFKKIGAIQLAKFPNLQPHHHNKIELWLVNIKDAVGRYLNYNGVPLKQPPETEPNDIEELKVKRAYTKKVAIRPTDWGK